MSGFARSSQASRIGRRTLMELTLKVAILVRVTPRDTTEPGPAMTASQAALGKHLPDRVRGSSSSAQRGSPQDDALHDNLLAAPARGRRIADFRRTHRPRLPQRRDYLPVGLSYRRLRRLLTL